MTDRWPTTAGNRDTETRGVLTWVVPTPQTDLASKSATSGAAPLFRCQIVGPPPAGLGWSRVGIRWRLAGCPGEPTPIRTSGLGPFGAPHDAQETGSGALAGPQVTLNTELEGDFARPWAGPWSSFPIQGHLRYQADCQRRIAFASTAFLEPFEALGASPFASE